MRARPAVDLVRSPTSDVAPPLLSLCVPTYNRADRLEASLGALTKSIRLSPNRDRIQLCISDNGSTDRTQDVLAGLQRAADINIVCKRAPDNTGFSQSMLNAVRAADG